MNLIKLIALFLLINHSQGAFQDYFQKISDYFTKDKAEDKKALQGFDQKIPYEVSVVDEKFIQEAAKLTGVTLSELDKCQQRVVLQLKKSCHEMNDEDISKMAVMLLNCQSAIEERRIYPCTLEMSIKDCTSNMDADTWNTYHLMSNRVRAVCYSSRQSQFIGITEHTINKLLDTTRSQVNTLDKLVVEQENLKNLAKDTLENVATGNKAIMSQQEDMAKAQFQGQLILENNIKRLVDEKKLIDESQEEIVKLTSNVQKKLEQTSQQIDEQTKSNHHIHKELLEDLIKVQQKTQEIFKRIDESSRLLVKQNEETQKQYYLTLKQLTEVNNTINSLGLLIHTTRQTLDDKLSWISSALGGTDVAIDKIYILTWHVSFIILGMIICAFLSCGVITRLLVTTVPLINITIGLYNTSLSLNPFDLTSVLLSSLLVSYITLQFIKMYKNKTVSLKSNSSPKLLKSNNSSDNSSSESSKIAFFEKEDEIKNVDETVEGENDTFHEFYSPTPPLSRSGYYDSRSRSRTPLNVSLRNPCKAITRLGTNCKISAVSGSEFCRRHQRGDSIM